MAAMIHLLPACTTCMGAGNAAGAGGINMAIFFLVGATALALGVVAWCGWRVIASERGGGAP